MTKFWKKRIDQMSEEEWESLCDRCGKCCLIKLQDEDTDEVFYTSLACKQFNNNLCELTEIHRFNENELLQDAIKCANDENINFNNYPTEEHGLCLCWTTVFIL